MKKEDFFPKVMIVGPKLVFNTEAIETMDLDSPDAKVIIIEVTNTEKPKLPKEILIMKTNGSLCDQPESVKDVFDPALIRKVIFKEKAGEIVDCHVDISKSTLDSINSVFGEDVVELKLLVCNTETPIGKEFKEQFDITSSYYRFAHTSDKRLSVGKEKNVKEISEERVSIN